MFQLCVSLTKYLRYGQWCAHYVILFARLILTRSDLRVRLGVGSSPVLNWNFFSYSRNLSITIAERSTIVLLNAYTNCLMLDIFRI